ncbi:MAG: hypothetical protein HC807_04890 [Gammaproteobacteria bacterium]|nr:hypothetical protein [Gammaproteobacteria bacterium]
MPSIRLAASLAIVAMLAWAPGTALAQSAASFIVAIGTVQVFDSAGQARQGERGGALSSGDRVITGADGLAQIRFSDGAMLSVRANSDLKIEAHSYTGETDTLATTVLQLLRGGLLRWRRHQDVDALYAAIRAGSSNVLLVEAVAYEWDLSVLDLRNQITSLDGVGYNRSTRIHHTPPPLGTV